MAWTDAIRDVDSRYGATVFSQQAQTLRAVNLHDFGLP